MPSGTPQPARWCDEVETRISIMQPAGMRNGGMEHAPKPRSPSLLPSKLCSVPSLPEEPTRPFQEAAAEAARETREMHFLNIWYSSAGR